MGSLQNINKILHTGPQASPRRKCRLPLKKKIIHLVKNLTTTPLTMKCRTSTEIYTPHHFFTAMPDQLDKLLMRTWWSNKDQMRTILETTIASTTSINKGKATTATSTPKKPVHYFCLLHKKGKVSPVLEGLDSSFWGQIGVEFNFQSTGADHRCGVCINSAH